MGSTLISFYCSSALYWQSAMPSQDVLDLLPSDQNTTENTHVYSLWKYPGPYTGLKNCLLRTYHCRYEVKIDPSLLISPSFGPLVEFFSSRVDGSPKIHFPPKFQRSQECCHLWKSLWWQTFSDDKKFKMAATGQKMKAGKELKTLHFTSFYANLCYLNMS